MFILFFCATASYSQSAAGGGAIQGNVKDATGGVIPGAHVIITNTATGVVTNTVSNSEGYFTTPSITIGKYKIRVEASGMKAWQGELLVETGRTAELSAVLTVGQVSETVIIEGNITPLVNVTDSAEGATLDSKRIEELPVNGRNINTLLEDVTPGVEAINDVNGGVRIAGLMVYSTNFTQDGASTNNREFGGSGIVAGLEAIAEVKVETSTSSARYSTPTSVIITTKGGSNKVHGSLFETHRNNAFGVARARQDVLVGADYKIPKLIRNEFGGSIGGPVILPTFGLNGKGWYNGKNRTFFFVSREGNRLRQGITREFVVPTAAMRNGNFSQLYDSLGRLQVLYDPQTTRIERINNRDIAVRDPFPNNQIPLNRLSPLAKRMFALTPLPNDITNPLVANNLKMPVATNAFPNRNDDPTSVRIDHRFTEKDNFFIKASGGRIYSNFLGTATNNGAPTANQEANVTYLPMAGIQGAMSWTHTFSPAFFVETLFSRNWQSTRTIAGPVDNQKDYAKELGLPNPFGEIGFPILANMGFTTAPANNYTYQEGDNRRALYSIISHLEQNYTWVKKRHNIQFGGSFHNERQHLLPDQGAISGAANFNSLATALHSSTSGSATTPAAVAQTGYDTANFFLGHASTYTVGIKRGFMQVYEKKFAFYAQDSYRVTKRLTFTPGLRWDMNPAFHERNGQLSGFDVKNHALLLPEPIDYYYKLGATTPKLVSLYQGVGVKFESAAEAGRSKNLFKNNLIDLSPRASFAYRLFDGNRQMVFRGGYGIYTSALPMRTLLAQFSGLLPFRANLQYAPNNSAFAPGQTNSLLITKPTVIAGLNSANVVELDSTGTLGRGQSVVGMDENQPSLRIHEWNLAIEKQLSKSTVFRITYTGKHGVNADQLFEINPQPSDFVYYSLTNQPKPTGTFANVALRIYDQNAYTSVRILQKSGFINSSTWTAQIERRFNKGLGFQAYYTLTNALREAGNSFRDDVATTYSPAVYLPNTVPTDTDKLNRALFYDRDLAIPKHRVRWNWNYDLPFGNGQKFIGNANRFMQGLLGGWKVSGTGTILNTWFARPTNNWGEFGAFEKYGTKYKIEDCRATPTGATSKAQERCTPGYLYFNGYISPVVINRVNTAGVRTGVFGIPDNYKPAQKPINAYPNLDPNNTADTNNVAITLATGTRQIIAYDTGYHPWRNQYERGPFNWVMDASMLKEFRFKERLKLRVNLDVFNIFNIQGLNVPNAEGIASLASSYGAVNGFKPRQMQGTLRLTW
ncbi:MAG: TonB-dependent receptor [Acidobacteria bacterium]|nr:TonB-dependent receptor [Acidobacteriota bacterium]MBI3425612.1 TonB-dependent receptor [Acidobacteriota bacterium]